MKLLVITLLVLVVAVAMAFILSPAQIQIQPRKTTALFKNAIEPELLSSPEIPSLVSPSSSPLVAEQQSNDLSAQARLEHPPTVVRGIYMTSWSAGSKENLARIFSLLKSTDLNAVVVDIKDYSGYVAYRTNVEEVKASGAEGQIRLAQPNRLIKELHDRGVYVIGRISTFQDPILAKSHPEWALHNKKTGGLWRDRKGIAWMDASAKPVWDYNIALARDAMAHGFDEVNFDYIRFPSDGDLNNIRYPFWSGKEQKHAVIGRFFSYVREKLPDVPLSGDVFGLTTVGDDDLGIGQIIEDAYRNFDYVCPMIYPSHFAPGFLGYKNPAQHPYEVISHSLKGALSRLIKPRAKYTPQGTTQPAKIRPWLQVFDLGAVYTHDMIVKQIKATEDVLGKSSTSEYYGGWLLWDPKNTYVNY